MLFARQDDNVGTACLITYVVLFEKQCRAFEEEWFTFGSDIHLLREVKGKSLKVNALTVLELLFSCFLLFSGLDPICPQDHQPIGAAFPDRHCEREINRFPVRCGNFTNCTWWGMLEDLEVCFD